jgi:hypothetical protein
MTRNIVGNVPEPDELYGREEFIDHLWRQIEGNNILLVAPRRFGKTGLMNHVLQRPRQGWLPIYLDLEDAESPAEFVWRLTKELLGHDTLRILLQKARKLPRVVTDWAKDTFDEAEFEGAKLKFKQSLPKDWRDDARRLVIELEKADCKLIFILDELPSMLEKIGETHARDFLAWFRSVRLQRKDTLRRHRFIVGGSIGIDLILRRLDLPAALNDFDRLYVEPLTDPDAVRLVTDLARSLDIDVTADVVRVVLDLIGTPVPYFIHMFLSQLAQLPAGSRHPLTQLTIEKTYRDRVLGPTCKHYFDHYQSRLARYGRDLKRCAMAVLCALVERGRASDSTLYDVYSKCRKRRARDTEFNELMADLECDWYIVLDSNTNEYLFKVNVMRDWWRRWYGSPRSRQTSTEGR